MSGFSLKDVRYPRYQDTALLQLWFAPGQVWRFTGDQVFRIKRGKENRLYDQGNTEHCKTKISTPT